MAKEKDQLNPKQERFCQEFLKDLNAKQAAIRAGYAPRSAEVQGSRLLSHDKVSAKIAQLKAERNQKTGVDQRWVIEHMVDLVQSCMQEVPVRDRKGDIIEGEWTFDSAGANTALNNLAKHTGAYEADNLQKKFVLELG